MLNIFANTKIVKDLLFVISVRNFMKFRVMIVDCHEHLL